MRYCRKQSVGSRTLHYLRKYNEESSEGLTQEEIQDFCEINLAYLMDDNLRVLVSSDYKVTLSFRRVMNKKWIEIKDQVIPFLARLRNEYDLVAEVGSMKVPTNVRIEMIGPNCTYPDWFNIEDLVSDKIVPAGRLKDDYKVITVQFKIERKKV